MFVFCILYLQYFLWSLSQWAMFDELQHNAEPEAVDLLMEVQKQTWFSWNVLSFEGRSHPCS